MNIQAITPSVIKRLGLEALSQALGPIGMVRFLQQFETGSGDYSRERTQWLKDNKVKTIVGEIKKRRIVNSKKKGVKENCGRGKGVLTKE